MGLSESFFFFSEILLSIEAIHPLTGESVPLIVSPDVQNIPYTPDNEHLGKERERERERERHLMILLEHFYIYILLIMLYFIF